MSVVFVFVSFFLINSIRTQIIQHLCPMGGMLNNFNQDVGKIGEKCFYVSKFKSITSDPIKEGNQLCRNYSRVNTKLAQPSTPMENEIMRYLLQENAGSGDSKARALIGIVVKSVVGYEKSRFDISFLNSSSHVVADIYNQTYEQRYNETVGEVGSFTNEYYAYFLHAKNDLNDFIDTPGHELCTVMLAEKGNWEIVRCRDKEQFGGRVICESPVFSKCQLSMSSCRMNKTYQACVMVAKDTDGNDVQPGICPLDIPILPIFCDCCDYTEWSDWSGCAGPCHKLENVRFRIPLTNSVTCNDVIERLTCPRPNHCIGCEFGSWESWESCPKTCDDAVQNRRRTSVHVKDDELWNQLMCDKLSKEEKTCNNLPCDQNCIEKIGIWSACTTTCGFTGTQTRTVERIWNATGNGFPCAKNPTVQNCPDNPCPIDCEYTNWIDGICVPNCGKGTLTRTRKISRPARFGGSCTNETIREVFCFNDPCIINCTLGEWLPWETCSVTCGAGVKKRLRNVTVQQNEWGVCENDYVTNSCNGRVVCPLSANIPIIENPDELSTVAIIIYIVSSAIAFIIITVALSGTIYYVIYLGTSNKKTDQFQKAKVVMQEILGPNQTVKAKQSERGAASKILKTTMNKYPSKEGKVKTISKKQSSSVSDSLPAIPRQPFSMFSSQKISKQNRRNNAFRKKST